MNESTLTFEARVQDLLGTVQPTIRQVEVFQQAVAPNLTLLEHLETLSQRGSELCSVRMDGDCLELITGTALSSNFTQFTSYTITPDGELKIEGLWSGRLSEYIKRLAAYTTTCSGA